MAYGLQRLGIARPVRGDQFRRAEFERQERAVFGLFGYSEVIQFDGLSPNRRSAPENGRCSLRSVEPRDCARCWR